MANTDSTPTGGAETPTRFWEQPDDDAKFDQALQEAFGIRPDQGNEGDGGEEGGDDNDPPSSPSQTDDESVDEGSPTGASEGDEGQGGEGTETTGAISGETDFTTLFRNRFGRDPQPGEIEGYMSVVEWAATLTPEQQVAINRAYENPEIYLTPQQQGQGQQETTPDPLVEEYGEDHPLIQRIRQLEQGQQQITQTEAQRQQERAMREIETSVNAFGQQYELNEQELAGLQGAVAQSRILPGFVQANNGDIQAGTKAALEYAYWQNPVFRQRQMDREFAARQEKEREQETRKQKAAAVTGGGGNAASRETQPPKTNDGRWAAVTQGLAEAMNNGQRDN